MTASPAQAVDDILTVFQTAWAPTGFVVDYQNVSQANGGFVPPAETTSWARTFINHVRPGVGTLSGATGSQAFDRKGFLTVQIFVPAGEGLSQAHYLGKLVTDAFTRTATPRQVWFRNQRVKEVGPSGAWYQMNAIVDFNYTEVL